LSRVLPARLLALVLLLTVASPAAAATRLVLSVGCNRGDRDHEPLRFAEAEAAAFATLMTEVGGADAEDVTVLQAPDVHAFDRALTELARRATILHARGVPAEVVVFLSGHARNGAFFLGRDCVYLSRLREVLESMPADVVVVFLDACHAGAALRTKGARPVAGYAMEVAPLPGLTGRVLITSSGSAEPSYESDASGGSLFARNLLSGLRGAADADGDHQVTLDESYAWLYSRTLADSLAEAGLPQHPHLDADLQGAGALVLTDLNRAHARLTVEPGDDPLEVWVVDEARDRAVVEVEVAAGPDAAIAIPPGRYTVYLRSRDRARVLHMELAEGEQRTVSARDGRLATAGPVRTMGGGALPGRLDLVGGYQLTTPPHGGGAWLNGGWCGLEAQARRGLRLGITMHASSGRFVNESLVVRHDEVGVQGAAWFAPARRVQPLFGARLGVAGVFQTPQWADDAGWYDVLPPQPVAGRSLVASLLAEGGIVLRPYHRLPIRIGGGVGPVLLPGQDGVEVGLRGAFWVGLGVTP
jgi:hypothetical protein